MNRTDDSIVIETEIKASAERIFRALTDPQERVQWWGKGRARTTHVDSDLRPGGKYVMQLDAYGQPHTVEGVYREIVPPSVLSFTWNPSWGGEESLVRFDIIERDGVSTVRVTHSGLPTEQERAGYSQGWPFNLRLLKEHAEAEG